MVTAEFAVALPAFVVVVGAALFAVAVVMAQLRCVDAAAVAARMAARGDTSSQIEATSLPAAPGHAAIELTTTVDTVTATVRASVSPFGMLRFIPAVTVQAHVVEAREPPAPDAEEPPAPAADVVG
jgi:Flp pilus assembly protein TadG